MQEGAVDGRKPLAVTVGEALPAFRSGEDGIQGVMVVLAAASM